MEKQRPGIGAAVLVENEGKYLLAERNKENYNGYLVIPGGSVEFGETLEQAALREIKEETNLDVDLVKLIGSKEIINAAANYHRIIFFFLAKAKHTDIKVPDCVDIAQAKFFSMDEVKKLKIAESAEWVFRQIGVW